MDFNFLFRISVCFLLSFLIGIERQYRRRIIGLRTSILVALGAFLFVTFSINVGAADISRVASQVVAGMGFLGAGVILKEGKKIRGLTTAATLWCDAAIGVLCSGGAVFEAIIGTFLILFANIVLKYVNVLVNNISGSRDIMTEFKLDITVSNKLLNNLKQEIELFFKENNVDVITKLYEDELLENNIYYKFQMKKDNLVKINELEEMIVKNKVKKFNITKLGDVKIDEFED